jgi:hypothetical protein
MTASAATNATSSPQDFYAVVLRALAESQTPFLVGGGYALRHYTGLVRATRDLDVFLRRRHVRQALRSVSGLGYKAELTFPHWLAKIRSGENYVDLIFNSGNGFTPVDDEWFRHATSARVFDVDVQLCPVEEMIVSKAFIMERERFDGADILHLLRGSAERLRWPRLLERFGAHWEVLLTHLILFGFAYPDDRSRIPAEVMDALLARLSWERRRPASRSGLCRGTLLSRAQYLVDIEEWGLRDARLDPDVEMTALDVELWTNAVPPEVRPGVEERQEADEKVPAGGGDPPAGKGRLSK